MKKEFTLKEKLVATIVIFSIIFFATLFIEFFSWLYFPIILFLLLALMGFWVKPKVKEINSTKNEEGKNKEVKTKKKTGEIIKFRVAGNQHYKKNVNKLIRDMKENYSLGLPYEYTSDKEIEEFDIREYRYQPSLINFIQFLPDPDNEFDKNAIKVFGGVSEEKLYHIGYVPKNKTYLFHDLSDEIEHVNISVIGGPYKIYNESEGVVEFNSDFNFEISMQRKLSNGSI